MRIITKIKDYYDYLQGVYGIDDKVIYDRRDAIYIDPSRGCMDMGFGMFCLIQIINCLRVVIEVMIFMVLDLKSDI